MENLATIFKRGLRRPSSIFFSALLLGVGQYATHANATPSQPAVAEGAFLHSSPYEDQSVDGVVMVHVPVGCFQSGDPDAGNNIFGNVDALPDDHCFTEGFWIDKYEVTNADFERLHGQAAHASDLKHPQQPRVHITWYEADAFCRLRGGALPDEISWEYAARGPKNALYPNGNELKLDTFAGFRADGTDGLVMDVGSHPASASWVGAQDMMGNVWEWTAGKPHRRWGNDSIDTDKLPSDTSLRIIRGGAASFPERFEDVVYRSAFQLSVEASNEAWDAGFRCIRPEKPGAATSEPNATQTVQPTRPAIAPATDSSLAVNPNATPIPAGTHNANWTPIEKLVGDFLMEYVPAGCFEMGTDTPNDPGLKNESPRHRVCLTSPYWFDKYTVTNAQYKRLTGKALSILADVNLPVSPISWNDADAFCKLRGGQLPTEAQWEYAARGPQSWVYPWGDAFDLDIDGGTNHTMARVGVRPLAKSWVGALDLIDNAMQWVADWYAVDTYSQSVTNDPQGPASGAYRVLRGASFRGSITTDRAAYRNFNWPDVPVAEAGIRCIRYILNVTSQATTASPTLTPLTPTTAAPTTPIPALIPAGSPNALWTPATASFKGVAMQRVPAGCFFMGQRDDKLGTELGGDDPKHEVCLTKSFWIDQTEVSNDMFARLGGQALIDTRFTGMQRPRAWITWDEAQAFCTARGGSLPTEAQWEYAARGPESLLFPWGDNDDPDKVVSYGDYFDKSRPADVGSKPAGMSWVGALDMSGNVAEWVKDWYDETYVNNSPKDDPSGPEFGTVHGWRGGSYLPISYVTLYNPAWREGTNEFERSDWIGVRCILPDSAKPDTQPVASPTPGK